MIITSSSLYGVNNLPPEDFYADVVSQYPNPNQIAYLQVLFGVAALITRKPGLNIFNNLLLPQSQEEFKGRINAVQYMLSGKLADIKNINLDESHLSLRQRILNFFGNSDLVKRELITEKCSQIHSTPKLLEVSVANFSKLASNFDNPFDLNANYSSISNASPLVGINFLIPGTILETYTTR